MAKKEITVSEHLDWIEGLHGLTVEEACKWLQGNVPADVELGSYADYDYSYGQIYWTRLETDEEGAEREAKEALALAESEARERVRQESQAAKMERYALEEVALYAYLKQHEGNPKIGDMENLFRALQRLEHEGSTAVTSINAIKNCLFLLETGR